MERIWPAPKDVTYINFCCSNPIGNKSISEDITYIFLPRNTENFAYETSFLKRGKLIIDGDVESNPGPTDNMRTPKGRKMKKKNFNFTPKKLDMYNINAGL
jgi:hypothetical protein